MSVPRWLRVLTVLSVALVLGPLAASTQQKPACSPNTTVNAPAGSLCGLATGNNVTAYLGIPYAAPPTGNLRWQNPQPFPTPLSSFAATALAPACSQNAMPSACTPPVPAIPQSEDCLFLNVWVPPGAKSQKLPVMVFIHGGSFLTGSGSSPAYQGDILAATGNVIVVTLNYRLGVLGFLSQPTILGSGNNNFGLRDQIAALQWVNRNISSFGGDPDNVTLFGESAGAMSVGLHALFTLRQNPGLFQKALMESNPFGVPYKTSAEASFVGGLFRESLGCSDLACLQSKSVEEILAAESTTLLTLAIPSVWNGLRSTLVWAPWIDGSLITSSVLSAADSGALTVPTLLGTNQNEGTIFASLISLKTKKPLSSLEYEALVLDLFSGSVLEAYPAKRCTTDCTPLLAQLITDGIFTCANRHLATASKSASTYAYQFTQVSNFNIWPQVDLCKDEVCHGAEVPYVFDQPQGFCPRDSFKGNEQALSTAVMGYWSSFASNNNPNGAGRFTWPAFGTSKSYLLLDESPSSGNDPFGTAANCSTVWESFYKSNPTWSSVVLRKRP
jgi:carboxylesterase type B